MNLSALSPPAGRLSALAACLLFPLMGSDGAHAHDWYSPACCSGRDCAPIPSGTKVTASPNGYDVVFPSGERVFFSRDKVQPSQDGEIHACIGISARTPYCLYLPAGS
jgi:hypothetical protein